MVASRVHRSWHARGSIVIRDGHCTVRPIDRIVDAKSTYYVNTDFAWDFLKRLSRWWWGPMRTEHAVLGPQELDRLALSATEPAGDQQNQELKRRNGYGTIAGSLPPSGLRSEPNSAEMLGDRCPPGLRRTTSPVALWSPGHCGIGAAWAC